MSTEKLFPLRLPGGYHGQLKKHQTPTESYLKKMSLKEPCDDPSKKVSKWQRKIRDSDVVNQRKEFLVHPAKISGDNPDWLKATHHYYRRSEFMPLKNQSKVERKQFDVLGNKKVSFMASGSEPVRELRQAPQITPKVGSKGATSLCKIRNSIPEVAPKIGFIQSRQSLVRRPQLKVGSLYDKNFIDTYSVN